MQEGKKWYKSRTINFNALYLAIVAVLTQGFGINLSTELITALQTLMNLFLRKITNQSIEI